jgi:dTDP-4-amino-4,6-dideoxygalactose transaminase
VVARYRNRLHGTSGLTMPFAPVGDVKPSHHLAVVVLPDGVERGEIRSSLEESGIQTSVHYPPIHSFTAYRESRRALPRTDALAERLLTLPLYGGLTDEQVEAVIEGLLQTL